ncbi:MAG: hypothetical protein AAFV87_17095 [Pseudomonadota bacterium]
MIDQLVHNDSTQIQTSEGTLIALKSALMNICRKENDPDTKAMITVLVKACDEAIDLINP